jgi:hypothetical protein
MWHMRGQQQDLARADRDIDAFAILDGPQQHVAFELVEVFFPRVVVVILARIGSPDDHDDEVGALEDLFVANGRAEQVTMLVDPALEIERGQWSHRAGPVDGQWMERAPSISERPARTGWSAARLASVVAVLACAAFPLALSAAEDASTPAAPATASPPAAEPSGEETAEAPTDGAGQPEGSQSLPASLGLIEVIPAVWYERDLRFAYIGRTSYYSCSGLKSKVIQILEQMGVKPGFKVTVGSCYEGTRAVQPMPSVRHAVLPCRHADVLAGCEKLARTRLIRARGCQPISTPAQTFRHCPDGAVQGRPARPHRSR